MWVSKKKIQQMIDDAKGGIIEKATERLDKIEVEVNAFLKTHNIEVKK